MKKIIASIGIIISISFILFGFISMPDKYIKEDSGWSKNYERYDGGSTWSENYAYPYIGNDASNWTIESNLRAARYTVCNNYIIGGFIGFIISSILLTINDSSNNTKKEYSEQSVEHYDFSNVDPIKIEEEVSKFYANN